MKKEKTNTTLVVEFKDDETIVIDAHDHESKVRNMITFVKLHNAVAHNTVMCLLKRFAKRLANKTAIPVRFEDV
jgi:hypothetical protein